jgi:hypothetical protein
VAVDDALRALAEVDLRKSQVEELRFFGGLSVKERLYANNGGKPQSQTDF